MTECKIIYEPFGDSGNFEDSINAFLVRSEELLPEFKVLAIIPNFDENVSRLFIFFTWDELTE